MRRRSRLSPLDRFWMILGSVAGLILAPAAGIALLPDGDGMPGRAAPAAPDADNRGTGGSAVDSLQATTGSAPAAQVALAAAGQDTLPADMQMDFSPVAVPPVLSGGPLPRGGGASGWGEGQSRTTAREPLFDTQPETQPELFPAREVRAITPAGAGLPADRLTLATVQTLGTDPDTWGTNASYLIVSRPQDHMLETADGVLHMVINRGLGHGLTLVSSRDGGASWDAIYSFGPGNPLSTSDIRLIDGQDVMIVSYLNAANNVAFAMLGYDPFTGGWTLLADSVADRRLDSPDSVHASIVLAPDGTLLMAYTDELDGGLRLTLQQSTDGGQTWTGISLDQPGVDFGSARVLAADETEGIVYSNAEAMYWVTWDATGAWHMEVIDPAGTVGQFASHFSTVTEDGDVILANVGTDLVLRVMWLDGDTGDWSAPVLPIGDLPATNVQISRADDTGHLYIVYDDVNHPGSLVVLESRNGGLTWETEALLQTPPDMVSPPTRFEAPEHFTGDLVVTQQILTGTAGEEGLYFHSVDVNGPERPWAEVTPLPPDEFIF
jgi:hypothetical protein